MSFVLFDAVAPLKRLCRGSDVVFAAVSPVKFLCRRSDVAFAAVSPVKCQRLGMGAWLGLGLEDRKGREVVCSSLYRYDPLVV